MCIVANKGYYYLPHFVKKIDNEQASDTLLKKFRVKHEVLTKIIDEDYEAVIGGMQDVVDHGTARVVKIPGINICAKTGTAEKYRIIDKKRIKLKDNSMFVCFAPRENPRIAIAVVVENSGFGTTWAAPIASLMMEKYLNDTLRPERQKEVERISAANLMPGYLGRLQYIEDSTRAYKWFDMTKDSNYIRKFLNRSYYVPPVQNEPDKKTAFHHQPVDKKKPAKVPAPDKNRRDYSVYIHEYPERKIAVKQPTA
jgi:penicillin-binding protein 2